MKSEQQIGERVIQLSLRKDELTVQLEQTPGLDPIDQQNIIEEITEIQRYLSALEWVHEGSIMYRQP